MKKIVLSLSILGFIGFTKAQKMVDEPMEKEQTSWYHLNNETHNNYGIGTEEAIVFANSTQRKADTIIVAVIDSGVDINHEDLKDVIWVNPKEVAGNGKDDDKNGYVDDINGWDFIGGKNGNVEVDNLEITRVVKEYMSLFASDNEAQNQANQAKYPEKYEEYKELKNELENELAKATMQLNMIQGQLQGAKQAFMSFGEAYGGMDKVITKEDLNSFQTTDQMLNGIKTSLLQTVGTEYENEVFGKTTNELLTDLEKEFNEGVKHYSDQVKYQYNVDFDPRDIVGDDYSNVKEKYYGNNDVKGADPSHGTHVSGIIGATRNNGKGINGIAPAVRIMSVRTVPNGDERDKDVANAIRYAVDNGAKILNMSFGKSFSPDKEVVWDAIRYATDKGVLLVHAAGNDNQDIDSTNNFPTNFNNEKPLSPNWITVGASTYNPESIKASFSNFGKTQVDIFAPGVEIYSTLPNNTYDNEQGTSMAAPVVSGVAALVWSYYPEFTAQEIKDILIESGNVNENLQDISTKGVVVDANKAIHLAAKKAQTKKKK